MKISLRNIIHFRRKAIPAARRRAKSSRIFRRLFSDPAFRSAEHVALYYGTRAEVATRPFLKVLLKDKKVYLPATEPVKKRMMFRRARSLSKDLVRGPYGIMEPKRSCTARPAARMDLIVVPGVAFDRRGGRLGRGAGYYDRLLKKAGRAVKIGLCFREQIVKKVPMHAHDVKMDRVLSD
jgi:5-formyltetrahydrofolate cyclo-ligase